MLVFMTLYIVRVAQGPSIWDRLLGMNLISSKVILIIILYASLSDMAYLMDFAIVYALLGFISIIFVALFLQDILRGGGK
jgi:multicomponent Na+:H+ antiporter subunit F